MKLLTRIIACSLAIVITFSAYAAPQANASLVGDVIVTYEKSSIAKFLLHSAFNAGGFVLGGPVGSFVGDLMASGIDDLAAYYAAGHTDDDLLAAEQDVVTDIQTQYGTTYFNGSGLPVYYPVVSITGSLASYLDASKAISTPGQFVYSGYPISNTSGDVSSLHGYVRLPEGSYRYYLDQSSEPNFFIPYYVWPSIIKSDVGNSFFSPSGALYAGDPKQGHGDFVISAQGAMVDLDLKHRLYLNVNAAKKIDYVLRFHIECLSLVGSNGMSDSTSRVGSMLQAVNNNTSNTYNYYLAPVGSKPTADTVVSTAVYDEETLVFTEPVSGAQYQTTGWTYDYTTRTYDIALDAGTFKIGESDVTQIISTYGDDAATITYYDAAGAELAADEYSYVIASSKEADGSDDPGTGDHKHSYTDQITKDPGCTLPGVRTYTCSCGDSYTKSVPVTGHDWAIGTQVNASYDPATGELLQAGYVIYSCSTCGQQYKDDSNTGPPSSGSSGSSGEDSLFGKLGELLGTAGSGVLDLISTAIGKLLDGAIALLEMAFEKLGRVVEILLSLFDAVPQLFGGYLDMFGAVFAFIPEDIITLLTFGVACVIILGVWKMIRR